MITENVTPLNHPNRPEGRAAQAMADYRAGLADETKGRSAAHIAVIAYGLALNEGREGKSNIAFGQWVTANKLDVGDPWSDRIERHCAMKIAVVGTVPTTAFADCPNTRPTHMMKWYRKTHPTSEAKPKAEAKSRRKNSRETEQTVAEMVLDQGKTLKGAAQEIGAGSEMVAKTAVAREEGRREMLAELLDAAAARNFSDKGKLKIEDAIRIHKARLDKEYEPRVNAEVRKRIDTADDFTRKDNVRLRAENHALQRTLTSGAVFTSDQFKKLLMCVHPDNSASVEVRNEVLNVVKTNEVRLVKRDVPKPAPKPAPKPRAPFAGAGAQP